MRTQLSQGFESFGKYILLEKIATGGMAEVYLAKKEGASGIAKFIAIKRILPQFSENPEFIEMFKAEAKIAVNLSNSNVVTIHEFGVEKEQFFLVMDYVEGRNLRQILNKMKKSDATFSIEQVLYVIKEVAAGLDHAHRCLDGTTGKPLNITHRDMSPQNIMINFEGEVKIVDFGIAKAESQIETTRAGTLKGKFGYMSPEQAEGQQVDLRTDIFSLGIVLWELIANDRLFIANNEINTLRKIRDCVVPSLRKINPNVPQELERICTKALAKDRNLRYQTAADFHRDLSRFLNRQYPDFSPHDFSTFIKNIFSSEILEARKKQIEYARVAGPVEAPSNTLSERTSIVFETTNTKSSTASIASTPALKNASDEENSINSTLNKFTELTPSDEISPSPKEMFAQKRPGDEGKATFDAKDLPKPVPLGLNNARPAALPQVVTAGAKPTKTKQQLTLAKEKNPAKKKQTSFELEDSVANRTRSRDSGINFSSNMAGQIMLVLALVAGFAAFQSYRDPAAFNSWVNMAKGRLGLPVPPQQEVATSMASEEQTRTLAVTSAPSGAEILIDDKPTGDLTPSSIQIAKSRTMNVTLRMPGYMPYTAQVAGANEQVTAINASLTRARLGYIDVDVVGAGAIYIGQTRVAASGPLSNFAIPADTDVVVRVYDQETNAGDQVTVRVPENRSPKKITLIPKLLTQDKAVR